MYVEQNKILQEIFRIVWRFPRYISCYIAEYRLPLGECTVQLSIDDGGTVRTEISFLDVIEVKIHS